MPQDARPGKPAARLLGAALGLALLAAQLADLARGQSTSSPAAAPPAELAAPGLRAPTPPQPIEPLPDCDAIMIIGRQKCNFEAISDTIAQVTIKRPVATVFGTVDPALYTVPFGSNSLRRVMEETFPSNPAKPTSYAAPIPVVSAAAPRRQLTARRAQCRPALAVARVPPSPRTPSAGVLRRPGCRARCRPARPGRSSPPPPPGGLGGLARARAASGSPGSARGPRGSGGGARPPSL